MATRYMTARIASQLANTCFVEYTGYVEGEGLKALQPVYRVVCGVKPERRNGTENVQVLDLTFQATYGASARLVSIDNVLDYDEAIPAGAVEKDVELLRKFIK